jgi:hypothetical protein
MSANEKQEGGGHYARHEYQHWDFVTDLNLPYLIGCASKYLARWDKKNGLEDLRKADHYLEKAIERDTNPAVEPSDENLEKLSRFVAQLPELEAAAVYAMVAGRFYAARASVAALIDRLT